MRPHSLNFGTAGSQRDALGRSRPPSAESRDSPVPWFQQNSRGGIAAAAVLETIRPRAVVPFGPPPLIPLCSPTLFISAVFVNERESTAGSSDDDNDDDGTTDKENKPPTAENPSPSRSPDSSFRERSGAARTQHVVEPSVTDSFHLPINYPPSTEVSSDLAKLNLTPINYHPLWNAATQAFFVGDYDQSINYAMRLLSENEYNVNVLLFLAGMHFQCERLDQAIRFYEMAIKIHPNIPEVHFDLANVYNLKGWMKEALEHYEIAVRSKPDYVEAHRTYATALLQIGQMDLAIDAYKAALRHNPGMFTGWNDLGCIYRDEEELVKAFDCFKMSIDINPSFAAAWCNLGIVYVDKGDIIMGLDCLNKATELDPMCAEIHANLGRTYFKIMMLDKAEICYLAALSLLPNNADHHTELGYLYHLQGSMDLALNRYSVAIRLENKSAVGFCNLGTCYQLKGMLKDAEECYRKALALEPTHEESRNKLENLMQFQSLVGQKRKREA